MAGAAELVPISGFYVIPWAVGLALAVGVWAARRHLGPVRALGIGLLSVPVTETLLGILDSFGPLLRGGLVLLPYSRETLSRLYTYKLLDDLGYLVVGFLLYAGGARFWRRTPHTLAARLADLGLPMGGRSEGRSALIGLLGFPALLVGTIAVTQGTAGFQSLRQSDETSLFANMTVYHAVLISLAAAFGEELLYRGLMQPGLVRAGRWLQERRAFAPVAAALAFLGPAALLVGGLAVGWGTGGGAVLFYVFVFLLLIPAAAFFGLAWRFGPVFLAIAVQALVFGFAHSGYATWIHVLLPTLFGVVAGIAAWRFGIWSAIVLHLVVDLYAFLVEVRSDAVLVVLNIAFLANLLLSLGWGVAWLAGKMRKQAPAAP